MKKILMNGKRGATFGTFMLSAAVLVVGVLGICHYSKAAPGQSGPGTTNYSFTYLAGPHGSISGSATQSVPLGTSGTAVHAVPAAGYYFSGWNDGSVANPRTDTFAVHDILVTASFSPLIAVVTHTLTYDPGTHGSISGNTSQTVGTGSNGTPVQVIPNTGYTFLRWSDGSTTNPRTDTNVSSDISVTATYTAQSIGVIAGGIGGVIATGGSSSYTLNYAAGAHGSLTGVTTQTVAAGGSGTAVRANPAVGYQFAGWDDGSTTNPRTDTGVTASATYTASFTLIPFAITSPVLTYVAGPHGTLTGSTPQTVTFGGSGTAVQALPNSGYQFDGWDDGSTTNPRTDTNVTTSLSVTALFSPISSNSSFNPTLSSSNGVGSSGGASSAGSSGLTTAQILGSGQCPASLFITDNMRKGVHDGGYDAYNKKKVTQVRILQAQINRILGATYQTAAGPVDGSFGPFTKIGVQRLQTALNTILMPTPPLKLDGIVGPFTRAAMNNSCGGM